MRSQAKGTNRRTSKTYSRASLMKCLSSLSSRKRPKNWTTSAGVYLVLRKDAGLAFLEEKAGYQVAGCVNEHSASGLLESTSEVPW